MTELESTTKDELLEMAREHEIEGRSSMTKDELVEALEEAGVEAPGEERVEVVPAQELGMPERRSSASTEPPEGVEAEEGVAWAPPGET